jgi:adenylate cyclase
MGDEIERKWLVKRTPKDLSANPSFRIDQGYLEVSDSENNEFRTRRKGDRYFLTIKKGTGVKREETEIEIPQKTYDSLWALPVWNKIEKTRYGISDGEHLIELDIYAGKLEGLIVAEVEFGGVEASQSYRPPVWFDREVTDDANYKNKNLARNGLSGFPIIRE